MANKTLFSSRTSTLPRANTVNEAGGRAYKLAPKHALAQIAATGCFNGVYYTSAQSQLNEVRALIDQVDDNEFLAKLALYARERAFMKDMPAALLVVLSTRDTQLAHRVFDRVVDNGRVLRTVFQMVRSGQFGRKSLSSSLQRAFQRWLNDASLGKLLSASIGNDPSLRDVLRLARPTPKDNQRRALFGWLTEKDTAQWAPATETDLPREVQALIAYRQAESEEQQIEILAELSVRWDLLADAAKGPLVWKVIARKMGPQALRMNLNTLLRHEVFSNKKRTVGKAIAEAIGIGRSKDEMVDYVAEPLADPEAIRRSRQFPYQFLAAYLNASDEVPQQIKSALHRAAEIACGNIPQLPGPVVIGLDTSGSMGMSVTGWRGRGATSKMRCVDVAALFASAILRRNPDSVVVPFDTRAYRVRIDADDSILSLSERLARYGGGGTDCSIPLREANTQYRDRRFAGAVLVSDNESWVGTGRYGSTGVMTEWQTFVKNQLRLGGHDIVAPKLVCIDIQP
ncbi:MAG: TROVE domain-containing protein, partial [Planctomycetales bacterium]|nr:TROVE domain-containing protein [Planctomycetales bacterium]